MRKIAVFLLGTWFSFAAAFAQGKHELKPRADSGGDCYECSYRETAVPCVACVHHFKANFLVAGYVYDTGYTSCTEHNPVCDSGGNDQGPPWCETFGFCWFCSPESFSYADCFNDSTLVIRTDDVSEINRAADGILKYFLDAKLMTPEMVGNLIAETDHAIGSDDRPVSEVSALAAAANARYSAYREVFESLVRHKLTYGAMPVYPRHMRIPSPPKDPHQKE